MGIYNLIKDQTGTNYMKESIFYSGIRALFIAFFAVFGVMLAILLFTILIGALSTSTENTVKTVNTEEIMPNAEGKRELLSKETPVILQINVDGIIGTDELNHKSVKQQLIESREGTFKDNRVKGVLVHINTPGGTVFDADGIYRAIKEYKDKYKVPVYAFVDGLCASGGMYVASAADKINATDVSLIGSVGVVAPTFMNFAKLLDKIGVEALTLTAGTDKDAMNPFRVWKPGEERNYQDLINYYYDHFVNVVTENRPLVNKEKLIKDYGARVFDAPIAKDYGFIDSGNATLAETLKELVHASGIEEGKEYQVIKLEKKDWFSSLFSTSSVLFTGKIKHEISLIPELDSGLQNQFLYLYRP